MNSFDETEQKLRELIAKAVKSRTPNVVVSTVDLGALMFEMELWRKEYYYEHRAPEGIISRYHAVGVQLSNILEKLPESPKPESS